MRFFRRRKKAEAPTDTKESKRKNRKLFSSFFLRRKNKTSNASKDYSGASDSSNLVENFYAKSEEARRNSFEKGRRLFDDAKVLRHIEDSLVDELDSDHDSGFETLSEGNTKNISEHDITVITTVDDNINIEVEEDNIMDETKEVEIEIKIGDDDEDDYNEGEILGFNDNAQLYEDHPVSAPNAQLNDSENTDSYPISKISSANKTLRPRRNPRKRRTSDSIKNSMFNPPLRMDADGPSSRKMPSREIKRNDHDILVEESYKSIPILEMLRLPRGGISIDTEAVGRVQYGIPPETIKDSMSLGMEVPTVYILPQERFCREMGRALGVNLAEFEFPAYYNFFVRQRKCKLVADKEVEINIRRVFNETLLGPEQFRRENDPITHEAEDFADDFPIEAIPNFYKELEHFRILPNNVELHLELFMEFCHFQEGKKNLGEPPPCTELNKEKVATLLEGFKDFKNNHVIDVEEVLSFAMGGGKPRVQKEWTYKWTKNISCVATVYPSDATKEQIASGKVKRVEIFKVKDGTLYILHDVNEDNIIVGRIKFSGHVRVKESMVIEGFDNQRRNSLETVSSTGELRNISLPSFYPPSFGVTVLGNSHGFDSTGSTSGYVLWVNGRGIMIDPPPYSSATLEKEGIRPRTIVAIILTHCHADHDAGAFQKVLTGSPVVVITTPTIYKSFIRKYAALSALSPAILRHSHRHKAAIIGEPLRFQGANFYFIYTLHTVPCIGFRVEWRGRSMVFTGDHFNSPSDIYKLQVKGVMTKERADDLRNLPLQDTDLLLHESGVPPVHTSIAVLEQLPQRVKDRMYVVHTAGLPTDCELRVAPTGTAGTIRLDNQRFQGGSLTRSSPYLNEYSERAMMRNNVTSTRFDPRTSFLATAPPEIPLVAMRPSSSTDAWFTLNLLSAVPFLSSLSYTSTMEVLDLTKVDTYYEGEVVVPCSRRKHVLCVVWEGTCIDRISQQLDLQNGSRLIEGMLRKKASIWHAGDWSGPRALQPEKKRSADSSKSETHDIVAVSVEGVKVITIDFNFLHNVLREGSSLYRQYLDRVESRKRRGSVSSAEETDDPPMMQSEKVINLNVIEVLELNSVLKGLSAVQKRHLESLAEGPTFFPPGARLWKSGSPVIESFIVVDGTASFAKSFPTRNAPNKMWDTRTNFERQQVEQEETAAKSLAMLSFDAYDRDSKKMGQNIDDSEDDEDLEDSSSISSHELHSIGDLFDVADDSSEDAHVDVDLPRTDVVPPIENNSFMHLNHNGDYPSGSTDNLIDSSSFNEACSASESSTDSNRRKYLRRRSSRDRFMNKVLENDAYITKGIAFRRGHFLGDVSKMVAKRLLSSENSDDNDDINYRYGAESEEWRTEMIIPEREEDKMVVHNTTLVAGKDGCVVLVLPKASLIPFLDEHPGMLLSLLGSQVVI